MENYELESEPSEFLRKFYEARIIAENNFEGKERALRSLVKVPNVENPTLAQLEIQLLKDNGFSI